MKELEIHEFDMGIYPRRLWVVKTKNPMLIRDYFLNEKGNELNDNETFDGLNGFVMTVVQKETRLKGYIVCIINKFSVATIAHESVHVVHSLSDDIGLETYERALNEHIAYTVGWVADKINTINNKRKN